MTKEIGRRKSVLFILVCAFSFLLMSQLAVHACHDNLALRLGEPGVHNDRGMPGTRQGAGNGTGNGTGEDTEPPHVDPGTYIAIYQGRYLQFDGSGSFDKEKGDHENLSFNWSIDDSIYLSGATPRYRFTEHGEHHIALQIWDRAGNWNATNISVRVIKDDTGPQIAHTSPENDEMEINVNVRPTITFTDQKGSLPAIDPESVEGSITMTLLGTGKCMNLTWHLSDNGTVLSIYPNESLEKDSVYTVVVRNSILDMAGNNLSVEDLGWEFSFSTVKSLHSPSFGVNPQAPSGGDPVNITLEFTKRLDPATVSIETISVIGPDGKHPIKVEIGHNRSRVYITLVGGVEFGGDYALKVSGSISDEGGNEMGADFQQDLFSTDDREEKKILPPLFFYFLLLVSVGVLVILLIFLIERKRLGSRAGYEAAVSQLNRRRKKSRLMSRKSVGEEHSRESKKKKRGGGRKGRDKGRGRDRDRGRGRDGGRDGTVREKKESGSGRDGGEVDISDRRGTEHARMKGERPTDRPGKVSYYRPEELSSFKGKTYDMDDERGRRPDGRRMEGNRINPHGAFEGHRGGRRREGGPPPGWDRRERRRRPPGRAGEVDWG